MWYRLEQRFTFEYLQYQRFHYMRDYLVYDVPSFNIEDDNWKVSSINVLVHHCQSGSTGSLHSLQGCWFFLHGFPFKRKYFYTATSWIEFLCPLYSIIAKMSLVIMRCFFLPTFYSKMMILQTKSSTKFKYTIPVYF